MNPIRRELLNGLLVLVIASLLSVAFSAFQVSFNAQLWVLILMGIAIAVSGYILFEITLGRIITIEGGRRPDWMVRNEFMNLWGRISPRLACTCIFCEIAVYY